MIDSIQRRQEIVGVYKRVMTIVWQRLSPTFGIRTINAIARNVIARQAANYPAIVHIQVGQDGLEWGELDAQLGQLPEDQLRSMLDDFLDEFFEALANLIGKLVVGKIFKEAEQAARHGGEE